jgi:hypothetical protein
MGDDIATLIKLVKDMSVKQDAMAQHIAELTGIVLSLSSGSATERGRQVSPSKDTTSGGATSSLDGPLPPPSLAPYSPSFPHRASSAAASPGTTDAANTSRSPAPAPATTAPAPPVRPSPHIRLYVPTSSVYGDDLAAQYVFSDFSSEPRPSIFHDLFRSRDGEHQWGEVEQFPDPSNNWHGRKCKKCGIVSWYGSKWGSLKHPGYSPVNPKCTPKGVA